MNTGTLTVAALVGLFLSANLAEAGPRRGGGGGGYGANRGSFSGQRAGWNRGSAQGRASQASQSANFGESFNKEVNTPSGGSASIERDVGEGYRQRTVEVEGAGGKSIDHEVTRQQIDDGRAVSRSVQTGEGYESATVSGVQRDDGEVSRGRAHQDSRDSDEVKYTGYHRGDGDVDVYHGEVDVDKHYYYVPGYATPYYYPYSQPTTIIIQPSASTTGKKTEQVKGTLAPVTVVETAQGPVYRTSYRPPAVYAEKHGDRYYWYPGASGVNESIRAAIDEALKFKGEGESGIVIDYQVAGETVYLTNQRPMGGIFKEQSGDLYAWIAGVKNPSPKERNAIQTATTTHKNGGASQLAAELKPAE